MAGFEIDTSELRELAADLGRVPAKALPAVESVLLRGSLNVRDDMRDEFRKSRYFRQVAPSVDAERKGSLTEIAYEIGPRVGVYGGSLGGIAVDGGANGGGGTVDIDGILPREVPALEKFLGEALGKTL